MYSRPALSTVIYGSQVIGLMTITMAITGYPAYGLPHLIPAFTGHHPIGPLTTALTVSTWVTGAMRSAFTAVLITATDTAAMDMAAEGGIAEGLGTTPL